MYREKEKLCLKWSDFQENAISAFRTLREDREFTDVTLACEDGQQVEAHKVILASSSPFFQNLLRRNKHPHPLIYMRSMKSEDLVVMVDFLYFGEANVYQENLNSFLTVAEELKLEVHGFMRSGAEEEEILIDKPTTTKISPKLGQRRINIKQESFTPDIPNSVEPLESTPPLEGTLAFTDYTVAADLQDLDDKIKSMMEVSENCDGRNRKKRICKVCGKERQYSEMKQHIEANHIYGVSHICNTCGKTMRSRSALRQHNRKEHRYEAVGVFKELEPNFSAL